MKKKKAQAWGIDLVIAFTIFTIGMTAIYIYSLNSPSEGKEIIELLSYDGKLITESILSEGYPNDWDSSNVVSIGILNNDKINETKLESFYDLSQTEYNRTKRLFNTDYNYWFFLSQTMTINGADVDGIGLEPLNEKHLIKITRFTNYQNKPMTAYLYIWEN